MAFYDNIKLEKGMYLNNFTKTLEELDPSENYKNTELQGLDAFQRQLKRFNIKVSGNNSDVIEKFFKTSDSAVLFPEYIKRAVNQGIKEAGKLHEIIATKTVIQSLDYRTITSVPANDAPVIGEAALIPETAVRTQENLVNLKKRGRMLSASYESLRYQRLDLFTVILKNIGSCIARSQMADAVNILLNGDGNNNPAEQINVDTSGTLTYSDLLKLWGGVSPFELNTILASTNTIQEKILTLNEMKDATAGLDFQSTGKLVTPLGASLIHTPSLENNILLGLDKKCSLEMVQAGDLEVDFDKIINKQLQGAAISVTTGFAKIFPTAIKKLAIVTT